MKKLDLDLVLRKVSSLPTLPTIAHSVGELVNDPDSSSEEVAEVMKQDQSLTTRVLTLVNSAYYAIPGGVSDVQRAISYLGYNTVYQLVLTISIFDVLPVVPGTEFNIKELWKHSLGCAIASEAIAKHQRMPGNEEIFTAGLLHDIGKVALASVFSDSLAEIIQTATRQGITFSESERELGLPTHGDIGRRLAEKWRLPLNISAGIGYHHKLNPQTRISLPNHLHVIADTVALGDILCRRGGIGSGGDEMIQKPDPDMMSRLNLTENDLQKIQDEIPRAIERSKVFLELLG